MKHIAIYLRVSSQKQDTVSQESELKRWAAAHRGSIVWYRDKFTGKTTDRPGWNRLDKAMQQGQVSKVVVWRLDRLGRTAKGLTALFDELYQRKINLVSLRDGIDLSTAAGRMLANVLASIARFETEVRAERVAAGQAAARARGIVWGGSEKGRMIKVTPEQVAMIRRMKAEGTKITAIARTIGLSRPTIYARLGE
jgi:DNA invertase Pin-like site-specific DNA recombinase